MIRFELTGLISAKVLQIKDLSLKVLISFELAEAGCGLGMRSLPNGRFRHEKGGLRRPFLLSCFYFSRLDGFTRQGSGGVYLFWDEDVWVWC